MRKKQIMTKIAELDTTQEDVSLNGHNDKWKTFDDDRELRAHIFSKKPAEQLVEVPEWDVKVLCRSLPPADQSAIKKVATNKETNMIDYADHFSLVAMAGCYNPKTGGKFFRKEDLEWLEHTSDGAIINILALTILRLSKMLFKSSGESQTEQIRKN